MGAAAMAAASTVPGPASAQGAPVRLRILATSDLHANVLPYDYYRDRPDDTVGLARTASLIRGARTEVRNSVLVDNGDLIQGSPLGDYIAYRKGVKAGEVHPIFAGMNLLDYLCATPGNHEFNYGLSFLGFSLSGAKIPFVCANAVKADGTPLLKPWMVFDREVEDEAGGRQHLRIGVIGFLPPQIVQWDRDHLAGKLGTTDIVEAAERHMPELSRQSDIVIALCHSGITGGPRVPGAENAALQLARVPGIHAIVTGHQHRVFPGKDFGGIDGVDAERGSLAGIPAVMPGFWGSHLGIIDLALQRSGEAWTVTDFRCEARPIAKREGSTISPMIQSDPPVEKAVAPDHAATLAYVREPVGETRAAITSFFALVADSPSVQIVQQAQMDYVRAMALGEPALRALPVLSAAAPFKSGGRGGPDYYTNVRPGPVAIKDVADLYLYPNTVRAVRLTGAQVREWLERSAGIFNRIDPARTDEQALVDSSFPPFNFDMMEGVTYRIDVTQPSRYDADGKLKDPGARRILDLTRDGTPVREDDVFLVATNNYRAGGGGNFPGADGTTVVLNAPDTNRDVLLRYIVARKVVDPTADRNWSLAPLPPTCLVTFLTSPEAEKAVPKDLAVTFLERTPDGFAKFRLGKA
jgi:2',3'-cyclic-nucleotide 2'-phosphodiesterase/3'-nucleotidase